MPAETGDEGNDWTLAAHNTPSTILNDYYSESCNISTRSEKGHRTFTAFTRLPVELRSHIWKQALGGRRLIDICVKNDDDTKEERNEEHVIDLPGRIVPYTVQNRFGNIISGRPYRLEIRSQHRPHALLATDREARVAALSFYRIHCPINYHRFGNKRCLYINPDADMLRISSERYPELVADFMNDIKAYDPLEIGIQHLGFAKQTIQPAFINLKPDDLITESREAFVKTIANLQTVYFFGVANSEARHMFVVLQMERALFNRSYPILAYEEDFEILLSDPRSIRADLQTVSLGNDPRSMLYEWRKLEKAFRIERQHSPEFQYAITASPELHLRADPIRTRQDAIEYIRVENEEWQCAFEPGGFYRGGGYGWEPRNPDTPEKLAMSPMPAFGFWLFPLEALGEPVDAAGHDISDSEDQPTWNNKLVIDLSNHTPRLGVYSFREEI